MMNDPVLWIWGWRGAPASWRSATSWCARPAWRKARCVMAASDAGECGEEGRVYAERANVPFSSAGG
ncbi:MAG: hypothetical protein ACLT14_00765 [Butyricicoccaceae bacterium]